MGSVTIDDMPFAREVTEYLKLNSITVCVYISSSVQLAYFLSGLELTHSLISKYSVLLRGIFCCYICFPSVLF